MLNEPTTTGMEFNGYPAIQPVPTTPVRAARYSHILVPTSLSPDDLPALRFGLDLAALHRATLTVLYVAPPPDDGHSVHWLYAIERLHQGLNRTDTTAQPHADDGEFANSPREQFSKFVEQAIPEPIRHGVELHMECRTGDMADVVARFANNSRVDLLIMCSGRSSRWLPFLPAPVRRIMQLARPRVVLLSPGAKPHNGLPQGS